MNTLGDRKNNIAIVDDSSKTARLASTMSFIMESTCFFAREKYYVLNDKMYFFHGKIKFEQKQISLDYGNDHGDIVLVSDLKVY